MFTFATIAYNHEKYIIEHLESIKYQIRNYSSDRRIIYKLFDDCSQDDTVNLAKKWLLLNRDLFYEVVIEVNKLNHGTVQNYTKMLKSITTKNFRCLAGDDLFYKNDVFSVQKNDDLVFTPVIKFNNDTIIYDSKIVDPIEYLIYFKKYEYIKRLARLDNFFNTPGAFFRSELIHDQGLYDFLANFKWIEDAPQWHYIFNNRKQLKMRILKTPFVLYRVNSGISLNNKHIKANDFRREKQTMVDSLFLISRYPKWINPYKYITSAFNILFKQFIRKHNFDLISYSQIMSMEMNVAKDYVNDIRSKSFEFYVKYGREDLYTFKRI